MRCETEAASNTSRSGSQRCQEQRVTFLMARPVAPIAIPTFVVNRRHRLGLGLAAFSACASPTSSADTTVAPNPKHQHMHAMPHRFQDAEAWAKQFDDPSRDAWQRPDQVLAKLHLASTDHVADIGAGTGYFTVRIAELVPDGRVIATDLEADMVTYLGERAHNAGLDNVVTVQSTAENPALNEPVDVAFLCNVYHHIEERPTYFANVASTLAEGGRLVIVDFRPDAPPDTPGPPPQHRVGPEALTDELAQAGFVLQTMDLKTLPYQYIAEFVVNPHDS